MDMNLEASWLISTIGTPPLGRDEGFINSLLEHGYFLEYLGDKKGNRILFHLDIVLLQLTVP